VLPLVGIDDHKDDNEKVVRHVNINM